MTPEYENYLAHYGIKGQKWGQRNYQNADGSYTQAGAERYWGGGHGRIATKQTVNQSIHQKQIAEQRKNRRNRIVAIAAGVAVAGLAAYGLSRTGVGKKAISSMSNRLKTGKDWMKNMGVKLRERQRNRHTVVEYKGESMQATGRYGHRDIKRLQRQDRALTKTNKRIQQQWNRERDRLIRADRRREKLSEFKTKGKMAATATAGAAFIYARYIRKDDPNKKKRK
jgi:hypothetical protein